MLASTGAYAADDVDLNIGGFIWGDIGFGDRYDTSDDDSMGVSKAAVSLSPEYKNTRGVVVLGVDNIFNDGDDDDVEMQEVFIGVKTDLLGGTLDTTLGKQPLLFGLKPNGWVGDRSIQQGLEFGGAGGIGVSGQVSNSLILDWSWGGGQGSMGSSVGSDGTISIRAGLFDSDMGDTSVTDSWILQVRADDLFGTGLYGNAGYEQIDVGGSSEGIISVGAGWNLGMFDLSLEYQGIDQAIAGTADDETQIIAEAGFNLNEQWFFYVDYATSDEADTDTIRIGGMYHLNEHLDMWAEYSDDSFDVSAADTDSIDLRLAFNF
jgi:hypothetical protein